MSAAQLTHPPLTAAFVERFRSRSNGRAALPFDEFVDLALYDPEIGYYRQKRPRVGYAPGTDFFTASTSGKLFGELVCAAASSLLKDADLSLITFVEIGAESEGGIFANVEHPFGSVRTVQVGTPIQLRGPCVVFSNELFDAQPFRRLIRRDQIWREIGVALDRTEGEPESRGKLNEVLLPENPKFAKSLAVISLPTTAPEGYQLDLPLAASQLLKNVLVEPWTGLFLAFDYGKSWAQISHEQPGGTARAYHAHQQSNDLLNRPGEQDLTCHVVWDWLVEILAAENFENVKVESQESFFVHSAGEFIGRVMAEEATRTSPRKLGLLQLLHPAHFGQKFQVLHGLRRMEKLTAAFPSTKFSTGSQS